MTFTYWHFIAAPAALVFQAAPILFVWHAPGMFYGGSAWIPEPWTWPLSLTALTLCALIGLVLSNCAIFGLLTRSRLRVAAPLIAVCCLPALIIGMVFLRAVLVFLAMV